MSQISSAKFEFRMEIIVQPAKCALTNHVGKSNKEDRG